MYDCTCGSLHHTHHKDNAHVSIFLVPCVYCVTKRYAIIECQHCNCIDVCLTSHGNDRAAVKQQINGRTRKDKLYNDDLVLCFSQMGVFWEDPEQHGKAFKVDSFFCLNGCDPSLNLPVEVQVAQEYIDKYQMKHIAAAMDSISYNPTKSSCT